MQRGRVDSLALTNGVWHINGDQATADRVFLALGSHPKEASPQHCAEAMALDDALMPSKLSGRSQQADQAGEQKLHNSAGHLFLARANASAPWHPYWSLLNECNPFASCHVMHNCV